MEDQNNCDITCRIFKVRKKYATFALIGLMGITCFLVYFDSNHAYNRTRQELPNYGKASPIECSNIANLQSEELLVLSTEPALKKHFKKPNCDKLLSNLTVGKWVLNINQSSEVNLELQRAHQNFRISMGIPLKQWRYDNYCGFQVKHPKTSSNWPKVASFCDPEGPKPCCNNIQRGECTAVTKDYKCDCLHCVDTRRYKDALQAEWFTNDQKCSWITYSALEACAILNRLSTREAEAHIYFVGDSLIRNMFMGLELILAEDSVSKSQKKCLNKELKSLCHGENMFVLRPCHASAASYSLDDLENDGKRLCGGERQFHASFKEIGMPSQKAEFIKLITKLKGKLNSYIVLGIGLHFQLKADAVINSFLKPAIEALQYSPRNWPQFIWVHPLSIGLLKPPVYIATQGDQANHIYIQNINMFLSKYNIPVLDFRKLTTDVNSYDGTHYGSGINIMKSQILLNYVSSHIER